MSIIAIFVVLAVLGFVLYVLNAVLPMDPKIKTILNALAILLVVLWLLDALGLFSSYGHPIRLR